MISHEKFVGETKIRCCEIFILLNDVIEFRSYLTVIIIENNVPTLIGDKDAKTYI